MDTQKISIRQRFELNGKIAIVTGGGGLLGYQHASAIAEYGGIPILLDSNEGAVKAAAESLKERFSIPCLGLVTDITRQQDLKAASDFIQAQYEGVDILINNAAHNPKNLASSDWMRAETFPIDQWNMELSVGLTGAFLCTQTFGSLMASRHRGVILNVLSDLALIGPDQRIYQIRGRSKETQPSKSPAYCAVKGGLLALTRYFATYWAEEGIRVNALTPAGVENGQDAEFIQRLSHLIPLGRMAKQDEYQAAIVFLVSDASSYMTGANLVMDGGRTAW